MNTKDVTKALGTVATVASGLRFANALGLVGLERRRSTAAVVLPTLGAFGLGITVGAGLGLLFAPKPGVRLRDDISRKVNRVAGELKQAADKAETEVEHRVGRTKEAANHTVEVASGH